jgi:hypothetical protein
MTQTTHGRMIIMHAKILPKVGTGYPDTRDKLWQLKKKL